MFPDSKTKPAEPKHLIAYRSTNLNHLDWAFRRKSPGERCQRDLPENGL